MDTKVHMRKMRALLISDILFYAVIFGTHLVFSKYIFHYASLLSLPLALVWKIKTGS
jgi:hypothetical protein